MYDAIVVGARCAGSPTALLLARRGYRVLLVDRATFPSDTISTHFIHAPGVARLRSWGLLDRVLATGCPPIARANMYLGSATFSLPLPQGGADGASLFSLCPRRIALDKVLVDAAVEAGAELRPGFSVRELCWDGDAVVGIRGTTREGVSVTERASVVIGADGLHSTVARHVRPAEYHTKPTLTFGYYAYWSGVPLDAAEVYLGDGAGVLAFPTNDGLSCIAVGGSVDGFHRFRADIEGNYLRTLELAPALAERVRGAKRMERYLGTAEQPNYFRRPYGPGWALVGDAGYHRDFITGLGITDAFRDAELLAEALDEALSGRRPYEEAMARYEQRRNEIAMPLYEVTCRLAGGTMPEPALFLAFGTAMAKMLPSGNGEAAQS